MKKQAILIIAHNNIWTLKNIIEILDSKYFDIFIHIDKKSKLNLTNLKDICKESKIFIYQEINVRWADYSQVECELFLLEKATNIQNYTYYHLISGADLPIKTPKEIYNFFNNNLGKEFIHFETKEISPQKEKWIKYYYFFRRLKRTSKLLKTLDLISIKIQSLFINRLKNNTLKIMTGANWFSITNDLAIYILNKKYLIKKMFKYTRSADEIFLQTLAYNSRFKKNLYYDGFDDNYIACMRKIDWNRGNPYTYTITDIKEIKESKCMFARKFDENKDSTIITTIKEDLAKEHSK